LSESSTLKPKIIIVRPATAEDSFVLHQIRTESIQQLTKDDYSPDQIEAWVKNRNPKSHGDALKEGKEWIQMAFCGEEPVGYSCFHENWIRGIYVRPQYIRRGVGSALLSSIERVCRGHFKELWLDASLNAHAFYLKMGFVDDKKTQHELRKGGVFLDCLRMKKSL